MRWRDLLPRPRRPDRRRLLTFEHDTVIWAAIGLVAAAAIIVFGLYNVSARAGHLSVTRWALHTTYEHSVALRAAMDEVGVEDAPDLSDIALIQRGAGHFQTGCYACHSAPGRGQSLVALSMVPTPPHVTDAIEGWSADELNWILWNGVKMSGMPQWPSDRRRDEVWAVVAFLRAVPGMTEAEYDALVWGEAGVSGAGAPEGGAEIGALRTAADDPALATCSRCHGTDGRGRGTGAFPRLDILSPEYILASLKAYAAGHRHSGIMQPIAYGLTEAEMERLARHYGTVPALPAPAPRAPEDAALIARGRALALAPGPALPAASADWAARKGGAPSCAACHGPWPAPRDARYPSLAGQHAGYLLDQLHAWKTGERGGTPLARLMHPVADALQEDDLGALAAFYASLPAED